MKLIDLLIERQKRQQKYFKNYQYWAKEIKKVVQQSLKEVKVFVFGSILRKEEIPKDIDILIISPKLKDPEQKTKLKVEIWQKIGLFSPFEIHLITPEQYKDWYQYFIKEKIEI